MCDLERVSIIRHVRYSNKKTGEIYSRGGATIIFDLDYMRRKVDISFSVCSSEDNFCKSDGIRYAEELGVVRTLDLDAFQKLANDCMSTGFTYAYFAILRISEVTGSNDHREDILLKKLYKNRIV